MKNIKEKYQFVNWWPKWQGLYFTKLSQEKHGSLSKIYKWCFYFGFWEIRRWNEKSIITLKKQKEAL